MDLVWKTSLIYFVILLIMKIMGKREIGQLSLFDFVVLLLIADITAVAIDKKQEFFYYLIPIVVLVLIQKILSLLSLKFKKVREFFDGKESIIIYQNKLNIKEMKKQFYNMDDLLTQVRLKNIKSLSQIEYLILETNGEISVYLYNNKNNTNISKTRSSNVNSFAVESAECREYDDKDISIFPVIISGKIEKENLKILNLSKDWLIRELKKKNLSESDIKNIYYANYEHNSLFIMKTYESK